MRVHRFLFSSVLAAGVVGVLVVLHWPAPCPLDVKIAKMEPSGSGILDDAGNELWLVTLTISNRTAGCLYFPGEWMKIEAKVTGRWVKTENRCSLISIEPARKSDVLLLLPFDSEACRLRLEYAPESLWWRAEGELWHFGVRLPPRVTRWIYPPAGRRPHWRRLNFELVLPLKADRPTV